MSDWAFAKTTPILTMLTISSLFFLDMCSFYSDIFSTYLPATIHRSHKSVPWCTIAPYMTNIKDGRRDISST